MLNHLNSKQILLAFVEAINAGDVQTLGQLMTEEHMFIDAHGNEVTGREKMLAGWRGYFEWFPDYQIEITQIFENGDEFALFGYARGSFKGNTDAAWRLPAAWKAVVKDGGIALWQVYADTRIPFEIIERHSR
jgi:ketosteroid isomerase-like protein